MATGIFLFFDNHLNEDFLDSVTTSRVSEERAEGYSTRVHGQDRVTTVRRVL